MNKLVVTTLESKFHVFDMRTQHPNKGFAGLAEKVNSLWISFSLSLCVMHCIGLAFLWGVPWLMSEIDMVGALGGTSISVLYNVIMCEITHTFGQ